MNFELTSAYKPTGDQPEAIAQLTEGVASRSSRTDFIGGYRIGKNVHHRQCDRQHQQAYVDLEPQQDIGCAAIQRVQGILPQ